MKRTPIEVKGIQLRHAPWNPRAAISPESVEDLTASIRTDGLIQRLAVVVDPDKSLGLDGYEHYIVIAGNRRFVACVQAGLDSIPVEVMDVDIQTAKRMTLIENLQRRDVDPLMEAELIRGLTDDGMTIEQIAAETGRGEKWVWRRQQLTALSQKWRDVVANSTTPFSVDCLEHVARYSQEIQDKALGSISFYTHEGIFKWRDFSRMFNELTRDLSKVEFARNNCTHCPNNSANAPMLFDVVPQRNGKPAKWGTCLCASCFDKKSNDAVELKIKTAKDLGHRVVTVNHSWDAGYNTRSTPDEEHNVLYVWDEFGKKKCAYGVPKSGGGSSDAVKTEEDKERKRREKAQKKLLKQAIGFIGEWADNSFKNEFMGDVGCDSEEDEIRWVSRVIVIAYAIGLNQWICGNFLNSLAHLYIERSGNVDGVPFADVWPHFESFTKGHGPERMIVLFGLYRTRIEKVMPPELFEAIDAKWMNDSRICGPWIGDAVKSEEVESGESEEGEE